jgi:uncharacterized membrane protein
MEIIAGLVVVALLASAALASGLVGDTRVSARAVLRDKLERGDIRPEEYAAHVRALDDAA